MKNLTVITSNNATMNRIDTLNTFSDLANKYLDKGNKEKPCQKTVLLLQ